MKVRYPLTNPGVHKTYNPNWEPWVTEEEYGFYALNDCNDDDDAADDVKVTT